MHPSQQPTIIIKPTISQPNLDEEFKELSPSTTSDPMKLASPFLSPKIIPAINNLEKSDAQAQAVRQSQRLPSISLIQKGPSKIHSTDTDEFTQEYNLSPYSMFDEHCGESFTIEKNKRKNINQYLSAVSNLNTNTNTNNNSSTEEGNNYLNNTERTHKLQRKTSSVLSHPSSLEAVGIGNEVIDRRFPTLVTTTTATNTTTGVTITTASSAKRKQTKNSLVPGSGHLSRQSSSGANSLSRNSYSVLNGTTATIPNLFTFEPLDDDLLPVGRLNQQNTVIVDFTPRTPSSQQDNNNASYSNNTFIHLIPSNRGDDLGNSSPRKNKMDSNYSMSSYRSDENKGNNNMDKKKKKLRLLAECEIIRQPQRNDGLNRQIQQKDEEEYDNQQWDLLQQQRRENREYYQPNGKNEDNQIANAIPAHDQRNNQRIQQQQNVHTDFKDLQVKSTLSQFNEELEQKHQQNESTHQNNLKELSKSLEITSQQQSQKTNNNNSCHCHPNAADNRGYKCQEIIQHNLPGKNSKPNYHNNNNNNNSKESQARPSSKTTPGTQLPSSTPLTTQSYQKQHNNPSPPQQQDISILDDHFKPSQSIHQSLQEQSHEIITKLQDQNINVSNLLSQHTNNMKLIRILLHNCQSPYYISEFTVKLQYSLFPQRFLQTSVLNKLRLQGTNLMIAYCDMIIQCSPFYLILQYFYRLFCSAIKQVVMAVVVGIICLSLNTQYNRNIQMISEVFQWIIWLLLAIQGILIVALNLFQWIQHKQSAVKAISLMACILQIALISLRAVIDSQEQSSDLLLISVILPVIHVLSQMLGYYSMYKVCKALRLFQTALVIQSEGSGEKNEEKADKISKDTKTISNSKLNLNHT